MARPRSDAARRADAGPGAGACRADVRAGAARSTPDGLARVAGRAGRARIARASRSRLTSWRTARWRLSGAAAALRRRPPHQAGIPGTMTNDPTAAHSGRPAPRRRRAGDGAAAAVPARHRRQPHQLARAAARIRAALHRVAWDARGYGASDDYEGPLAFDDFVADLLRVSIASAYRRRTSWVCRWAGASRCAPRCCTGARRHADAGRHARRLRVVLAREAPRVRRNPARAAGRRQGAGRHRRRVARSLVGPKATAGARAAADRRASARCTRRRTSSRCRRRWTR